MKLLMFPNLQFIYELNLVKLEMATLSPSAILDDDFRSFLLEDQLTVENVRKRSAYICCVDDVLTDYAVLTRKNITRAFNQYITHWFYPYKGKFHPQMVRALANIMGLHPGDTLLDPFSGSGTSVLEGALLGLKTIGYDVSPLCVLIGKMKTNAIHHLSKIEQADQQLLLIEEHPSTWNEQIVQQLSDPILSFDLLSRLISKSDEMRRGHNYQQKHLSNRAKMIQSLRLMKEGCAEAGIVPFPAKLEIADARCLPISDQSVDGVITSPPYSIALNYVENDAHALEMLGYDLNKIKDDFIGVRGVGSKRYDLYEQDMEKVYQEIARVLKPGKNASIIVGNMTVNGKELDTVTNCIRHCARQGLQLVNKIEKIIYGLYNVMQHEWILIFQRTNK